MAFNNNAVYNAAIAGSLSGVTARWNQDAVPGDYAGTVGACVAFATRLDSKIPLDGAMNQSKADLVQGLCNGVLSGRNITSAVAADYDAIATALAALYTAAVGSLV